MYRLVIGDVARPRSAPAPGASVTLARLCARRVTRRSSTGICWPLGQLERLAREVVALLLVGRLEARDLREVGEVARVLLVLRAVHRRVVGDGDDEPAVRARHREIHERVGGDVEPDVLHRDQRALAGIGDAGALLQRDLLVGRPQAADGQARPLRVGLDGLEDLRRRRSRIGVRGADAGVDRPARDGLVSQQYFVRHVHPHDRGPQFRLAISRSFDARARPPEMGGQRPAGISLTARSPARI